MMSFEGATCKEAIVVSAKPGWCRVRFDDLDGLESAWLPVVVQFAMGDKAVHTLQVGAQAACVMDARLERGWVVGCIYSEVDVPPTQSASLDVRVYEDGTRIEYDKAAHTLTAQIGGCTVVASANGIVVTGGDVVADGVSLKGHVHTGVLPGGANTGAPAQ
jgi:phage baseplate assembly protein V